MPMKLGGDYDCVDYLVFDSVNPVVGVSGGKLLRWDNGHSNCLLPSLCFLCADGVVYRIYGVKP